MKRLRQRNKGDDVEKDLGEAWYWLKRAQQENVVTSSITQKSLDQLLEEMNERERWSVSHFADYYDDLDLSDVTIPPAFKSFTENIPKPLSDQEIELFVQKFHGLSRSTDREKYISVERDLVIRAAGIHYWDMVSIEGQIRPLGMSNDEFMQRKCNYHHAIEKIFPRGRNKIEFQLRSKEMALSSQFEKGVARTVNDVLQAGRLCPNPESKAMLKAVVWAKNLDQMPPADLRKLATMHFDKSGSTTKTKFTLGEKSNHLENKHELVWHFLLARTIWKFADQKEREK